MPNAITHFEILELPDSNVIESLINGNPLVINTKYPIADQNLLSFERTANFTDKALNLYTKYKTHDTPNLLESNEALINLIWNSIETTPSSSNLVIDIVNNQVVNLLDALPLNDAVQFIEIVSMSGLFKNLKSKGFPVISGQQIDIVDLLYTNFTANAEGGGDPYFVLTYLVGKNGTTEATQYTLTLNLDSIGFLAKVGNTGITEYTEDIDTGGGVIINYPVIEEVTILKIQTAYAFGVAQVSMNIESPFLSLNPYNYVAIDYNGNQFEEFDNILIDADVNLDENGAAILVFKNVIVKDTLVPKIGKITVTLNEVNGDNSLVDTNNNEYIIFTLIDSNGSQTNFTEGVNAVLMNTILTGKS